jgi:hypothetical protein
VSKYQIYLILGDDCPDDLQSFAERGYKVAEYGREYAIERFKIGFITRETDHREGTGAVLIIAPEIVKMNEFEHNNFRSR